MTNQYTAARKPDDSAPYCIVNTETGKIVEHHWQLDKCHHACNVLNNQEEANGRPRIYRAEYKGNP